ncbi:MAG: CotH kinase family protein [Muribaculaceae bacterium]|nr:CotH kinase family protein [Muribaculaceae bacterium]
MMKRFSRLIMMLLLALVLGACVKTAGNFPPDNTGVRLDSTNLPIVWIEVGGDSIMRDERIGAHMKIIWNGEGRLNYADTLAHPGQHVDYNGYISLRHRGNSTYNNSPKKPYSFRTLAEPLKRGSAKKRRVSLLGMPKDNNWALLAPYSDKSMIRDMLTFELARPWMEYVPRGRHCELFVDGIYYGVFVLAEVVSKGRYRLDLNGPGDSSDELTGDYLMEVDCDDDVTYTSKYHPVDSTGKPYTDHYILFQYKSPDRDNLSRAQLHYINSRIDAMEASFAAGNYSQYIDVASFIDYQLMMELCHNVDAYRLSGKFYKRRDSDDPRFKMVLWDSDLAYGNAKHRQAWRTDTWMYRNNDIMYKENEVYMVPFWWYVLNNDPKYTAQVKARWAQYRQGNMSDDRLMATVDSLATVLTSHGAEQRNSMAWPRWGVWVWNNYYVATSYADEIAHLKQWLVERIAWMDRQLDYQPQIPEQ